MHTEEQLCQTHLFRCSLHISLMYKGDMCKEHLKKIFQIKGTIENESTYLLGGYLTRNLPLVPHALTTLLAWYEERALTPHSPQVAPLSEGASLLQRLVNHEIQEKIVLVTETK